MSRQVFAALVRWLRGCALRVIPASHPSAPALRSHLALVALLLVSFWVCSLLISQMFTAHELLMRKAALRSEIVLLEQRIKQTRAAIVLSDHEAQLSLRARDAFHWAREGDTLLIVLDPPQPPAP